MCDWKPSSSQFQDFASLMALSAPLWPRFSPPLIINGQALDLGFGSGRGLQRKLWRPLPSLSLRLDKKFQRSPAIGQESIWYHISYSHSSYHPLFQLK